MINLQKRHEKIGLLVFFKFFISFVYIVLTNLKEPLILLAADSGAEVLPVLKGYFVFPASILFVLLFNWLTKYYKATKLFFYFFIFFLSFFLVYILVLVPHATALSPSTHAAQLLARYPHHKHWIAVYHHWIHALVFVCIELYGQITIFLIFWGIANDLCTNKEAESFYHIIIASGCIGGIVASEINIWLLKRSNEVAYYSQAVYYLFGIAILGIIMLLIIYTYLYLRFYQGAETSSLEEKLQRKQSSLRESLHYLITHRALLAIAVMVLACGLTINLVDVTYKANLKKLYATKAAYHLFTARIGELGLVLSTMLTLFVSGRVMKKFSWKLNAYVAPLAIISTGIIFFLSSKFRNYIPWLEYHNIKPLVFVIYLGVVQTMMSKLTKYSFFDASKEMAYLGLDADTRMKGKGAVDLVGSRAGKAISGFIHTLLLFLAGTSNVLNLTHILLVFLLIIGACWFWAIRYLDHNLLKKEKSMQKTI